MNSRKSVIVYLGVLNHTGQSDNVIYERDLSHMVSALSPKVMKTEGISSASRGT